MIRRLMSETGGIKATCIQQIDTQAGDIVFANPNSDSKIYYRLDDGNDIIPKSFVPIGVVVIPASHDVYGTGACGVMSLKLMSKEHPETGTLLWETNEVYLVGGYYENKENEKDSLCYIGENGVINKEVQGISNWSYGHLPSDIITEGTHNLYDSKTYYHIDTEFHLPSPYNDDNSRNSAYYQISEPSNTNNALAYFNGYENTKIISSKSNNTVVAEICCNKYKTQGTNSGDWYLPSIAEFGYLPVRLKTISDSLNKLAQYYEDIVSLPVEEEYYGLGITSTAAEGDPYCIDNTGSVMPLPRDWYSNAFAFIQIGSLERNYGDIYISGGSITDIPASGGESQITGYTYSQTYGYGDSTTNGGVITSGANIEVTSISADTLGTTEKERTKIGESVITVTMNGKSAIASYEVYQEANVKTATGTSGGAYSYGNISAGSISNATIGAGGGSATAYAGNGSQSWSRTAITTSYSYTSGATSSAVTMAASSGTNSVAPSASSYTASANSKGTNVSGVTTVGSKYITWSANGKSVGGTMYVYQAANAIVSRTWLNGTPQFNVYTTITNLSGTYELTGSGDCAAGSPHQIRCNYSKTCSFTITFRALAQATFTSGSTGPVELTSYNQSISSNDSIGLTVTGSYPTYNCTLTWLDTGKNFPSDAFTANICFSNTCRGGTMLKIYRSKY